LTSVTWAYLKKDLEDVVVRHPKTWPGFKRGDYDWDNIKHPPKADPSKDYVDDWGSVWRTSLAGNTGVVIKPVLANLDDLDAFTPPDPATYNGGLGTVDWEVVRRRLAHAKANGHLARGGLSHGYHMLRLEYLRGFENLMCDAVEEAPAFAKLVALVHDLNKTAVRNWIDAGAEVIGLPEDLGSQRGSILGPPLFRKWVTPYMKELHEMAHAAGCLTEFHCDGNIMDVADQILEIAPDVFNLQDVANGVENIKEAFKGRLCVRLDFDRQRTQPFGTPQEIRELLAYEVRTLGSARGGLMISAEVRGKIPPENIDAIATACEDLGGYWFD